MGQLQRINWNDLEMIKYKVDGVGKVSESSFQQNLSCIFIIFLEGAAYKLLHEGQTSRTLQKMLIEKFTIFFWLSSRKCTIYGWKGI